MKDIYGRKINYLRLSVTELCNLRCRYCMPEEGVCKKRHEDMLTEEEMVEAVEIFSELGIEKVRITGGDPLVKKNIVSICQKISQIPNIRELCLTTNGINMPKLAKPLREAGVDRVNISLDTLDPEKYHYITRWGHIEDAINGIEAAIDAGFEKIKLNTVLVGGFNDNEIENLTDLTRKYPVDVRFIELMPIGGSKDFGPHAYVPNSIVLEKLPELEPQSHDGGTARLYRLPGAQGNVGLISSMSNHFCSQCNRMRLTADGKLKPCLHSADEYPIKGLSRDEIAAQFRRAVEAKPRQHCKLSAVDVSESRRCMNQIGG